MTANRRWTVEEDTSIAIYYPEHGMQWDGWADEIPNRTINAIGQRAYRLGVYYRGRDDIPLEQVYTPKNADKLTGEPWTDAQRVRLITISREMCEQTSHTLLECMREFWRIWLERKGRKAPPEATRAIVPSENNCAR